MIRETVVAGGLGLAALVSGFVAPMCGGDRPPEPSQWAQNACEINGTLIEGNTRCMWYWSVPSNAQVQGCIHRVVADYEYLVHNNDYLTELAAICGAGQTPGVSYYIGNIFY